LCGAAGAGEVVAVEVGGALGQQAALDPGAARQLLAARADVLHDGDEALGQALGATQRRRDDRGAPERAAVDTQEAALGPDVVQGAVGDRAQSGRMPVAILWVDEVPEE